jgi:hypothetical protein
VVTFIEHLMIEIRLALRHAAKNTAFARSVEVEP